MEAKDGRELEAAGVESFALKAAPGKLDTNQKHSNPQHNTNRHRGSRQEVTPYIANNSSRCRELRCVRHKLKLFYFISPATKLRGLPTCAITVHHKFIKQESYPHPRSGSKNLYFSVTDPSPQGQRGTLTTE